MAQTITEKIVQSHAVGLTAGQEVRTGDMVTVRPFHIMTHDNTGAVMPKFQAIGASRVADPTQPVFALDHNVQDSSDGNLAKYGKIEAFAKSQGIVFHPARAGIGHQLMIENGFVHPGTLVVASDSHSNMYGAMGAVGTPVVRTDAAAIWATGTTWWQVPRTIKVVLKGKLAPGVTGKDLIITLCGLYNSGEVLNAAIEFHGPAVRDLTMAERLTISNMTTEWGALVGWFPCDEVTIAFLRQRRDVLSKRGLPERLTSEMISSWEHEAPAPDNDAHYSGEIVVDLAQVSPHIAGPDVVSVIESVASVHPRKVAVHKAYLLSCVNARYDDLKQAADVLRGQKIADSVELYLAAASAGVQSKAEGDGTWQALVDAGAIALEPGCGACIGLGKGLLEAGEVGISATNRNFKGRMGSRDAKAFLASPAVVAASAVAGYITGPGELTDQKPEYSFQKFEASAEERTVEILDGFTSALSGRVLLLPADNLNTDGIYSKDVTYRDDLTPAEMATYAMENYDPEFQKLAEDGDIIVSGKNFGTGSSREQAATALKFRGIQMVIAASFSQTYLRNAFNNAFICLESPALAKAIKDAHASDDGKTIISDKLDINFASAKATWRGETYAMGPLGPAAQELILAGGLEALTKKKLEG